jgi:hypothetical protein
MKTRAPIDDYLAQVDSHLTLGRAERQRALEEIDGHLTDAVETLIAEGVDPEAAGRRAIEEFGPAAEVARGFSGSPVEPAHASRRPRWFDWLPIAFPGFQAAICLVLAGSDVMRMASNGSYGLELGLAWTLIWFVISAGLTAAGWALIRQGRRTGMLWPAWVVTGVALVLMVR